MEVIFEDRDSDPVQAAFQSIESSSLTSIRANTRSYEAFPLICPTCRTPLTITAFLTDPDPITQILAHIGEPTSPPLTHPVRGPPQTELDLGPDGGQADEVAQESHLDDLDQSPEFDPPEPEPIPEDDFDQSWEA